MATTGLSADPKEYRARLNEQTDEQIDAWAAEMMRDVAIRRGVIRVIEDFRRSDFLPVVIVFGNELVVPQDLAGADVEHEQRVRIQVLVAALLRRKVWRRVRRRDEHLTAGGVERNLAMLTGASKGVAAVTGCTSPAVCS